ncbi:MAG: M48 family metallopeptidase [Geminicoccaceae bacterium]
MTRSYRRRYRAIRAALVGPALAVTLAACQQAPVTGRNQLILMPESQATQMGLEAYQQIKQESRISNDRDLTRRVQEVGRRIAEASPNPEWDWEFTLFENPEPNAFALPGGKVGVNTGLFKVAENDDQLAAVVGHEVAHAIARHGSERMSQGLLTQIGVAALGVTTNTTYAQLAAQAATLGIILPYSRTQEAEADHIGLLYMAEAGYDPREAIELWQNFNAFGGARPPEFLSTHPAPGSRIERLQELMPEAMEVYQEQQQQ